MNTEIGLSEADWSALYRALEVPLYNAAFRYVWQRQEAQDLVQEAFLQLWQRRQTIGRETADRYLWVATLNLARKRRRWRALRQFLQFDEVPETTADDASPDAQLADAQQQQRLVQAMDRLSEKLRSVLMLTEFSEYSYEMIAEMLAVPPGTVASRRHLALKRLRADLITP